jgi:hypothetical protein
MSFLPDGRMLITEKAGEMLLFDPKNGTKIPVAGIPAVDSEGQGGLMDVVLSPTFAKDKTVYFSFSQAREGGKGVALATGALVIVDVRACRQAPCPPSAGQLSNVKTIFRASQAVDGNGHYSGRIAFSPDGRYHQRRTPEVRPCAGPQVHAGQGAAPQPRRHARRGQSVDGQGLPSRGLVLWPSQPAGHRLRS